MDVFSGPFILTAADEKKVVALQYIRLCSALRDGLNNFPIDSSG